MTRKPANEGDDVEFSSVGTERGSVEDSSASYRIRTQGSDIVAVPQREGLATVTDTDIGPLLEEIIINQLPPTGSVIEAKGLIKLTAGDYPGDLSNGTHDGVPVPSQCRIHGEASSHDEVGSTRSTIPTTTPGTRLTFSSRGFITPNESGEQLIWAEIADVQLIGPGASDNASVGIDGAGNTNTWDFTEFKRVNVNDCDAPIQLSQPGFLMVNKCKFERYVGEARFRDRTHIHQTNFGPENDGGRVKFTNSTVVQCEFDGVGEAEPLVTAGEESYIGGGTKFRKAGGGTGAGTALALTGPVHVGEVRFKESPGGETFQKCIDIFTGTDITMQGTKDFTTSTYSVQINGGGGAEDIDIQGCYFPNGYNLANDPQRVSYNDTVFDSTAPTGSNYGPEHAGLRIVDTSGTPWDEYIVQADGSLLGPK